MLVDKAQLLTRTAPENDGARGGRRVMNANFAKTQHGVFTRKPEALTNDFFVNLIAKGSVWKAVSKDDEVFKGRDGKTGAIKWTGTRVDLVIGSNYFIPKHFASLRLNNRKI